MDAEPSVYSGIQISGGFPADNDSVYDHPGEIGWYPIIAGIPVNERLMGQVLYLDEVLRGVRVDWHAILAQDEHV